MTNVSSLDAIYFQKIPKILTWIALPCKIHFIFSFLAIRNAVTFEPSTKFRFSTNNDLKTAKLPQQFFFKLKVPFLGNSCEAFDDVSAASDVDDDGCFQGNKDDIFFGSVYKR